ncbi:hypothetical protein FA15DRAFT_653527 [Coprinopsis marcescibilis]|uniref:Uncharacterized protein n=1 Tax=Coprinopsis marcescibilis TaxID=230819 RepID=A0A5C3L4C6_COPMA|nr:hypothetical protein FA15DRAFT_653527 [Coprinopsis marcescibilis]
MVRLKPIDAPHWEIRGCPLRAVQAWIWSWWLLGAKVVMSSVYPDASQIVLNKKSSEAQLNKPNNMKCMSSQSEAVLKRHLEREGKKMGQIIAKRLSRDYASDKAKVLAEIHPSSLKGHGLGQPVLVMGIVTGLATLAGAYAWTGRARHVHGSTVSGLAAANSTGVEQGDRGLAKE